MSSASRLMLRELDTLRNRIDRIFSEDDLGFTSRPDGDIAPPLDIQETETEIIVKASMPGIRSDDVDVNVDNNVLTIRGTSREERDEENGKWHVHERRYGSMFRSVSLPSPVEDEKADATLTDGVLEIHLPKSEKSQGRKITVKSS
jgi:HSP20 family protein